MTEPKGPHQEACPCSANGSLTWIEKPAAGEYTYFQYTDAGLIGSAHVLPEDRWNYFHYDGRQTRYCIEDSQGRKFYYWDGLRLMERYNATTETARTFTHGPSPLAGIANMVNYTEAGQTHDFHYDVRGTVTSLTDGAGDVAQTYEHDAWGVRLSATGRVPAGRSSVRQPGRNTEGVRNRKVPGHREERQSSPA